MPLSLAQRDQEGEKMRLLKWRLLQAKLKINNEYEDANVKTNATEVFCLALVNLYLLGEQKGNKRMKDPFIAFCFFHS